MSTETNGAVTLSSSTYLLEFEKPLAKMEREIQSLEASQLQTGRDYSDQVRSIRAELEAALRKTYENLTPWENVLVARHPKRPQLDDYIRLMTRDFCELHGDRLSGDDRALITGFARLAGHRVMLIGHRKGRETKEKIEANFGCAHPEGYRKALAKMKLAAKFKVPVVCLIDTPGAYPGVEAEERGIAQAIAVNLMEISRIGTPIIAAVIGEGGSGGALGIGVADQVGVMENAYYSVISPEGCAAILWKTGEKVQQAANALRLTPKELKRLELIDAIIEEPLGGAHRNPQEAARNLESWIDQSLRDLRRFKLDGLLKRRYERLRNLGSFFTVKPRTSDAATVSIAARPRRRSSVGVAAASIEAAVIRP